MREANSVARKGRSGEIGWRRLMCEVGRLVGNFRFLLRVTGRHIVQGQERDSSDDEWDAAYAALDPIVQNGWRSCRARLNRAGADLVRDVFAAADEMHDSAMSAVDGNTQVAPHTTDGADSVGEASATNFSRESSEDVHAMEVDMPGEMIVYVCIIAVQ